MTKPPPAWLLPFTDTFGAVLRTPLARDTGTLRDTPELWPGHAVATVTSRTGLGVYNRQYWFRLFSAAQAAYPLTTRLLGAWAFNGHAAAFFADCPPSGHDLDDVSDGLAARLAATVADPRVAGAAAVDRTWHRVFRAPDAPVWRPGPADAPHLADALLVRSPAVALVVERWPLLEARAALSVDAGATLVVDPPAERSWLLVRAPGTMRLVPLEPAEARLHTLLDTLPLARALAQLERETATHARTALPEQARRWLDRAAALGAWRGYREGPPPAPDAQIPESPPESPPESAPPESPPHTTQL